MQNTKLLSVRQASEYLGVHIETLRRWDREGKLSAVRVGRSNHRRYTKESLEKFKKGQTSMADEKNYPISIYADRLIDFHSPAITDEEYFTRMVMSIAERVENLVDCELLDGPNDKKRDIIGYEIGKYNKRLRVYIQCKHVKDISERILKIEVDGLLDNISNKKISAPSKLIFALSTNINSTIRDNIRQYVEQLLSIPSSNVVFWCPPELDERIKGDAEILNRFILTATIDKVTVESAGNTEIEPKFENIKRNLTRSSQLIQSRQYQEAEEILLMQLGNIPDREEFAKEKAKIYNNLGLCYKWSKSYEDGKRKAVEAFNKALDYDPSMWKAVCNLINTLLLFDNKHEDSKAWILAERLWKDIGPEDEFIVITYIQAYSVRFGKEKAIKEAEKVKNDLVKKGKESLVENAGFWHFLASTYFFVNDLEKATEFTDKILTDNEYDLDAIYLRAMIKMRQAKESTQTLDDFLDNFKSSKEIKTVENLLKQAYKLAKEEKRFDLLPEIYHNWDVCRLWLWKTTGEKIDLPEYPLSEDTKIETSKLARIPDRLLGKDYEGAFNAFAEISKQDNPPPMAKYNIARIFNDYGYPEISLRILDEIEIESPNELPYRYWLFKSVCQVLTENKALAISSCNMAKELVKNDKEGLKEVLSHTGALFIRYQKEGDRLLQNALEYDNEFPTDKSIIKLDINKSEDKSFIVKSMTDHRRWFEKTLSYYRSNPVPVYFLEKSFKRTFIELWAGRGANFPWEYHIPSEDYKRHLLEVLESGQGFVFDYISLLTLTKANLLGFVERTGKPLYVHRQTFNKIQDELVQFENPTLRKLWDYLRKSSRVTLIASNERLEGETQKLSKVFDPWLLQSIQMAKDKKCVFVSDDLRLSKAISNEGIEVVNSFTFLVDAFERKWISKKDYSQILGEISDCVYSFIPFNYEDLSEIIWQDDYKLTRRSYHLIHQILLPNAGAISFINVFNDFIVHLWQSGALSEDKIYWLKLITDEVGILMDQWEERQLPLSEELREFVHKFALMWGNAVQNGTVDDIKALELELASVPEGSIVHKLKDTIQKHIKLRLGKLSEKAEQ